MANHTKKEIREAMRNLMNGSSEKFRELELTLDLSFGYGEKVSREYFAVCQALIDLNEHTAKLYRLAGGKKALATMAGWMTETSRSQMLGSMFLDALHKNKARTKP